MNFLTSKEIHGLVYVFDGPPDKVLDVWGDKPRTIVTPECSQEFQQELMHTDLETLKQKYDGNHLLVLTDAAWVDYEPVFSRTLSLCAQPKLLVMVSSLNDGDLLPLVNLVRANDRLPMLFDHTRIDLAIRGHVLCDTTLSSRHYATPLFNPFDPYTVHLSESTAFTKLLFAVRSQSETIASFLNFNGSLLFSCNTEMKKNELLRYFKCNGFIAQGQGLKRADTVVYVCSPKDLSSVRVDQLHVVEPPENIARTMAQARSTALTVYFYVLYSNPFEEPPELRAYRSTLGRFVRQHEWFKRKPKTIYDAIAGLFMHNPLWSRASLVAMVQLIMPGALRADILREMYFLIQENFVLVDMFEREGYLVLSENMFIYQPFLFLPTDSQ